MSELSNVLASYLEGQVQERLARQEHGRMQLVFVGPPKTVLQDLFELLTDGGQRDWKPGAGSTAVAVLLVDPDNATAAQAGLSAITNWDYAITLRHEASLLLVTPGAWKDLPESIDNTSDLMGNPRAATPAQRMKAIPWPHLLDRVSTVHGVRVAPLRLCFQDLYRDARELGPSGDVLPWLAADDLLSRRDLPSSLGLPSLPPGVATEDALKTARKAIADLAVLCAADGFDEIETKMNEARDELREANEGFLEDDSALLGLFRHLRDTAGSGTSFARSPSQFMRGDPATQPWRAALPADVLEALLKVIKAPQSRGRLALRILTPSLEAPARDEPWICGDAVSLSVVERTRSGEDPVENATIIRRYPGQNQSWSAPELVDGAVIDDEPPEHDRPIGYKSTVPTYADANARVIVLDAFECMGHVHVSSATRNPPPARRTRGRGPFEQVITVRQAGVHRVTVFTSSAVQSARLGELGIADVADRRAVFDVYLEEGQDIEVSLLADDSAVLSQWNLVVQVEEETEGVVQSKYEDLLLAHQEVSRRQRLVLAKNCQLRNIETQVLAEKTSALGLIAAWRETGSSPGEINWDSGTAGDIPIPGGIDTRPPAARRDPPAAYADSRAELMDRFRTLPQQFPAEFDLALPEFQPLVVRYITSYLDWLQEDPEAACWAELLAVHVATGGGHPTDIELTPEPAGLLISPYHPIRLAWHANAQAALSESLGERCPLAGLLSPTASPSVLGLPLWLGQHLTWRSFISVPCDDKHWVAMVSAHYLSNPAIRTGYYTVLKRLGLLPQGVTGGMTVAQAKRSLDDVCRILPTRSTLRVGLVGNPAEEAGSVEGLLRWVEEGFNPLDPDSVDESPSLPVRPAAVEVFDFRQETQYPSESRLALLSESAGDQVRWFGAGDSTPMLDLLMFDQVDVTDVELTTPEWSAESRSVLAPGALYRLNLRSDQGAGRMIAEARLGKYSPSGSGELDTLITRSTCELESHAADGRGTHLVFVPNQQALDNWVQRARFLTATSSQLDPACFIRGSGQGGSYLWDYDLPGLLGLDAASAGYYLLARPREAMKEAISKSLELVYSPPPAVDPVLIEISRRGIPVLKRLASGGSRARGEVGMLLAVRLLQDAFRNPNSGIRLAVANEGGCVHMLLAVDSYREPLDKARRARDPRDSLQRADLLVFSIVREPTVQLRVTPLEVKFLSAALPAELLGAIEQANHLGSLLRTLWVDEPDNRIWDVCSRALLAQCLDECFRVYADPSLHGLPLAEWTSLHGSTIDAVLGTDRLGALVTVNGGRVLAFGTGFTETKLADMDGDGVADTLTVNQIDAGSLLGDGGALSAEATTGLVTLAFTHPLCAAAPAGEPAPPPPGDTSPEAPVRVVDEADEESAEEEPDDGAGGEQEADDDVLQEPAAATAEIRAEVAAAFDGFIGNLNPLARVKRDLTIARMERPPHLPRNYLFVGLPSVGKTELARRIAAALGLPFIKLDGPSLKDRDRLFEFIDGELGPERAPTKEGDQGGQSVMVYPPFVVFVDEIHLVPQRVQESMLTLLEAADRSVRLSGRVAKVPRATFLFATTQPSRLDKAFRSRCTVLHLAPYSVAEVAQMVRNHINEDGWDDEIYPRLARLGRVVPRRAFEVARELRDEVRTTEHQDWSLQQHLDRVRHIMEIDENGLARQDLEYLDLLARAGRPLGEDAIVSIMGTVDKDEVLEEIEPVLRTMGLIYFGARGREITDQGKEYLASHRYNDS